MIAVVRNVFFYWLFSLHVTGADVEDDWIRGASEILLVEGAVTYASYTSQERLIDTREIPIQIQNLGSFSSSEKTRICVQTSGPIYYSWEGPGTLSMDQLQHKWSPELEGAFISRAIFYIESGSLSLNSNALSEHSSVIVESPLGKIIQKGGLFSIQSEYFEESLKRICTVKCFSGDLKYYDLKGAVLALSAGQKLVLIAQDQLSRNNTVPLSEEDLSEVEAFNDQWEQIQSEGLSTIEMIPKNNPKISRETELKSDSEFVDSLYFPILKPRGYFNFSRNRYRLNLENLFFDRD